SFVQEMFSGIRVVKAYNRETYVRDVFEKEAFAYKDRNIDLVRTNALFFPLIILLIGLSTLITVYVGGTKVFSGEITTGTIAEFIVYVGMLTWPVASIGWVTSIVQRAAASQTRINEFLNRKPGILNPDNSPATIQGGIEFKNVSFTYPDSGVEALRNVSFDLQTGKSLAIVGRTGSGKSTIASIICRLYDVGSGSVLIDGKEIRKTNLNALRSSIGYVPQEVFLFSETIGNNIAFGLKNAKSDSQLNEKVREAAADADILDSILSFPNGFETRVGERGLTLSGGQKQRISIARALIREPQILILDDCLSAVDTQTEEKILRSIRKHMENRTTVIISHRISSVMHCDEILVLDHGVVAESGTHQTLLSQNGIYAEMYNKQLLEEEKTAD
ncbi:MAG: ABC transporter ATP-binding protein, partial [Bacteroidetes bacterium]|nr:ABC transporter ATP-binding protein [Bacteroidota bacterium]